MGRLYCRKLWVPGLPSRGRSMSRRLVDLQHGSFHGLPPVQLWMGRKATFPVLVSRVLHRPRLRISWSLSTPGLWELPVGCSQKPSLPWRKTVPLVQLKSVGCALPADAMERRVGRSPSGNVHSWVGDFGHIKNHCFFIICNNFLFK